MKTGHRFILLICMGLVFSCLATEHDPRLLVVFIDGFRWDYISNLGLQSNLPNFRRIYHNGASVERLKPIFPTDCYPNIYSIFTGLPPTKHGVIFNEMYSSVNGDAFYHEDASTRLNSSKWVHADTIWQQLASEGKKSYLHHLPTCVPSNDSFHGQECVAYNKSDMNIAGFKRGLEQAMNKLKNDFHFAVVYHDSIDQLAHKYGPKSDHITKQLLPQLDEALGSVLDEIDRLSASHSIHLVIVSDHGLAESISDGTIFFDRSIMTYETDRIVNRGTTLALWVKPDFRNQVLNKLTKNRHYDLFTNETLPAKWRLNEDFNHYFPDFYLMAHLGYVFNSSIANSRGVAASPYSPRQALWRRRGWHGYHPDHPQMQTPLLVYGPRTRKGVRLVNHQNDIDATSVYHLMADLMQLPYTRNFNVHVEFLLTPSKEDYTHSSAVFTPNISVFGTLSLLVYFVLTLLIGCLVGIILTIVYGSKKDAKRRRLFVERDFLAQKSAFANEAFLGNTK